MPFSPKHLAAGALVVALGVGIGTWQGLEHSSDDDSSSITTVASVERDYSSEAAALVASLRSAGVSFGGSQTADPLTAALVDAGPSPSIDNNVDGRTQAQVTIGVAPAIVDPADPVLQAQIALGVTPETGIATTANDMGYWVEQFNVGVAPVSTAPQDPASVEARADHPVFSLRQAGVAFGGSQTVDPLTEAQVGITTEAATATTYAPMSPEDQAARLLSSLHYYGVVTFGPAADLLTEALVDLGVMPADFAASEGDSVDYLTQAEVMLGVAPDWASAR
jgi:hypothetical protein